MNMYIFAVSEVSGGSYCNRNANSETEIHAAFDKQSRIQCLIYLLQMINSCELHIVQWWQMPTDDAASKSI